MKESVQQFVIHAVLMLNAGDDKTVEEAAELRGTVFGAIDALQRSGFSEHEQLAEMRDQMLQNPVGTWEELVEQAGPFQFEELRNLFQLVPAGAKAGETYQLLTDWLTQNQH